MGWLTMKSLNRYLGPRSYLDARFIERVPTRYPKYYFRRFSEGASIALRSNRIVGTILPDSTEVEVDLVRDRIRLGRRLGRIGDQPNLEIWCSASFGQNEVPAHQIVQSKLTEHAADFIAPDIYKVKKVPKRRLISSTCRSG
jgi:hypothetical protein